MNEAERKASEAACHADPEAWAVALLAKLLDPYVRGSQRLPARPWHLVPEGVQRQHVAAAETLWGALKQPVRVMVRDDLAPVRAALLEGDTAKALELLDEVAS